MSVKHKFKTQAQKVLKLVTHSLYSNKDIFLRELVSNSSDAIEKLRFDALTNKELLKDTGDFKIKIIADKETKTLTISDNGIGMSEEELVNNLGTIARSGTETFLDMLKDKEDNQSNPEFIGQFGVGFYSSFMVSSKISVHSRRSGDTKGFLWECSGEEEFSIEEKAKDSVGTSISLSLNEDSLDYLEEWKLREIVRKYADYIEFPVVMDIEKTTTPPIEDVSEKKEGDDKAKEVAKEPVVTISEETLNSQKAMWLRNKEEITEAEYEEFYKHLSHDFTKPLKHIHYNVEGATEFSALIYIPSKRPFDLLTKEHPKSNIHLYVKRVFILSNSEYVLPEYLRFVFGVVDSSDLPLNISREHIQEHAVLKVIKKNLIKKVLSSLAEIKDKDIKEYREFVLQFGSLLKEGVYSDFDNREQLLSLLLYYSTKSSDELISLDDYIDRMQEGQKEIYFVAGDEKKELTKIAHLEVFKKKDYEVLFFLEPIDEIMLQYGLDYKGKQFKSILKGDIDFGAKDEETVKEDKSVKQGFSPLNDFIKKELASDVKDVRISDRLVDSVACLVNDTNDMSANLEKIMQAYNKDMPPTKRILELNPAHAVVAKMRTLFDKDVNDPVLKDFVYLIYDQALISEGSKVSDPIRLCKKISELLVSA